MPTQLFYSVTIPVTLWFISKNKKQKGKTLFIDARKMGFMVDRKHRDLSDEDIAKVDEDGVITPKAVGTATITVKKDELTDTIDIHVIKPIKTKIKSNIRIFIFVFIATSYLLNKNIIQQIKKILN